MKGIRKLIKALSEEEIEAIKASFYRPADKISVLFNLLVDNNEDIEIRTSLNLSPNAYSTLGSRLNNKIQNFLVDLKDSPRADVMQKLLTIDDILFVKEPAIANATLKKLERELTKYDLSNELTVVYKHLKKLNLNNPEYFHYSKLYNRHVAYSLALDKAEDILGQYFKEYAYYHVMGDESRSLSLKTLFAEMVNVSALYQSHRMQVFLSALEVMHRLFIDDRAYKKHKLLPLEDVFNQVDDIFGQYPKDNIYVHLKLQFKLLRFEYYYKHGIDDKAVQLLDQLLGSIPILLLHYENYGFPSQVLEAILRLRKNKNVDARRIRAFNLPEDLYLEGISTPARVQILLFRALVAFERQEYQVASRRMFDLNNQVSFKEYPFLLIENKCLTAIIKYFQEDQLLFKQNLASAQRLIRKNKPKKEYTYLTSFVKLLSILNSGSEKDKNRKVTAQLKAINEYKGESFHPLLFLDLKKDQLLTNPH